VSGTATETVCCFRVEAFVVSKLKCKSKKVRMIPAANAR
jgi:hypothetical protein